MGDYPSQLSDKSTGRKTFHSPRVVPGSPLRAPTVTPPVVPLPVPPSLSSTAVPPPVIADMAAEEEVTVADLTKQLKQAFEEISLGANYPMPTFNGKKGENPEDHCMKTEDYFKVYKIVRDEDKRKCFTDTFFLTARRWADQLPDTVTNYDFDPDNEDSKKVSIKYQFLQRFAVKGRTTEAIYTAWMQLSFDSSKDDIEEFINEVKNLARRLGYNEQAQVMAIKNHLPLEFYHNCLTINELKDLTNFLVKLYNNPKMKEMLGIKDKAASTSGVTKHAHIVDSSGEIGKLKAEIGELKFRMQTVNSDPKAKVQKFKPVITPPRRRGSNFHGGGSFGNWGQGAQNIRDNRRNQNNGTFQPRGQNFPNRGNKSYSVNQNRNFSPDGRFGGRGRFNNSPNVRCPR